MKTSWKLPSVLLGVTILLGLAAAARADYFEGSLSYDDGLYAAESWADPATSISWVVTNEDPNAPTGYSWKYTYTLTVPNKDISHIIIEASVGEDPFGLENLTGVTGTDAYEAGLQAAGVANPSMPADLYGIKFDDLSDTEITVSFYSDRAPVWGDFYAKGGKDKGNPLLLYNTGFTEDDPIVPPSSGSVSGHLLRPDSFRDVPEPGLLILLSIGATGLLRQRSDSRAFHE